MLNYLIENFPFGKFSFIHLQFYIYIILYFRFRLCIENERYKFLFSGLNYLFVSENESCDHYCACYRQHLLSLLQNILEKSSTTININKSIEIIRDRCNQLIDIQSEAYQRFYIRQRSTIRLKLMIEFLRVTKSLQGVKLEQLPQPWICDNQDKIIPLI
jgi:hypothetical protein